MTTRAKLAACWVSFMFLYVYVDILGLYMPGVIDDILAGIVWELDITQTWAFAALALMAVPILMVILSTTLPARANRVTSLAVASIYVPISAANALGESWTYYFALAVGLEVTILGLILRLAWTWPRTTQPDVDLPLDAGDQLAFSSAAARTRSWNASSSSSSSS